MVFKIKTYNTIHSQGLDLLPREKYSVSEQEESPDAIICRSANLHDIAFPSSLKAIARAGAGVNNIPVDKCTEHGLVVFNTLGANANAVKELVFASMLIASRNLYSGIKWVSAIPHTTSDLDTMVESQKKTFVGSELQRKTLGVIGLGAIGHNVANLGISFNMNVIGFDPFLSLENALQLSQQVQVTKSIEELVAKSDFISLHVGYSSETHHLLNESLLSKCKRNATILNFARKDIVDEKAILTLLEQNQLFQYITDFPSPHTLSNPKVISFPHLGASTAESEKNCSILAIQAIRAFLEKGVIQGSVNYPNCQLNPSEGTNNRLVIGNENTANIVGQITNILGNNDINIEDMINTHRNTLAYNIIDTDKKLSDSIIEKLRFIQGIKFLRQITFS